ncbi:jg17959 [Pararge aegeria aegeria]|uniref:Jg17959 protein n=1 Tax=Pararge aegeria aegeria TaxID=348720 RepID=A0A8S4S529_9NEOP|nr:jg17959 [Pararge aegeria aegeria]
MVPSTPPCAHDESGDVRRACGVIRTTFCAHYAPSKANSGAPCRFRVLPPGDCISTKSPNPLQLNTTTEPLIAISCITHVPRAPLPTLDNANILGTDMYCVLVWSAATDR